MTASASLKDLSKAINGFISQPALPLPDALHATISAYLRRHERQDEAASDRLQEELFLIFDRSVKGHPNASGPWIGILRRLLPVLKSADRILPWFDRCQDILDSTDVDRQVVEETTAALADLTALAESYPLSENGQTALNPILHGLLKVWVARHQALPVDVGGDGEHVEKLARHSLKAYGKKRPQELFACLDACFLNRLDRQATLSLLCDFIQDQPPHLHQVRDSPIFSHLLFCLLHDTSTSVVCSAMTALLMLLPHLPSSLVPHLPTLFNIYARLLFWDREAFRTGDGSSADDGRPESLEMCPFDAGTDGLVVSQLADYYTILYGLYPINFMDYIRKPQRYLRHSESFQKLGVEVQSTELQHRTERFRRSHRLHPNFYTLTVETERTDFSRWIKSEAAEVVVECMALRTSDYMVSHAAQADTRPPRGVEDKDGKLGGPTACSPATAAATDGDMQAWMGSRERPRASSHLTRSASNSQLREMVQSNKLIKSEMYQTRTDDSVPPLLPPPSPGGDSWAEGTAGTAVPAAAAATPAADVLSRQVSYLQQRARLLENDLNFERYVKQQHMVHMGELRRRLMAEAAGEAEMQDLMMTNRSLKSRVEEARKAEMQVRRESDKGRLLAKKWEAELAAKLKSSRGETRRATAEASEVGRALRECQQECGQLRRLVCEAEAKEVRWNQQARGVELQGTEVDQLRAQVEELTRSERDRQAGELERRRALRSATEAEAQVALMRTRARAQEDDSQRAAGALQEQIADLQGQLAAAQEAAARPGAGARARLAVEGMLAASRAKQAELQKQQNLLLRKYTALQSALLDMQAEAEPEGGARFAGHG